ncbi:MAG: sulfopyruvate decarboxylase subunit beta [Nitrospirae bacterium]|nr:sulfopyruvate decarboxylase subunit beta [Nitrospirota bacterium]
MPNPEEELISELRRGGVDLVCTLPCDRVKRLISILSYPKKSSTFRGPRQTDISQLLHIPLTREEEGVGICAGAALAGKRTAIVLQNSGIGNMINALLSLTYFYRLPLALFISHRGIYKEKIAAQIPMGKKLPGILKGAGISYSLIESRADLKNIGKKLTSVYRKNSIHAFLLSPAVWEDSTCSVKPSMVSSPPAFCSDRPAKAGHKEVRKLKPVLTRYEMLEIIAPYLDDAVVVSNLGVPSKELFHIKHRPSNFYMLGSMGMATPIGLGIALSSDKKIIVIDGDGSLLMNPGSLATAAYCSPENLTILAIDNGAYGSTGNQPTLTGKCVDLELVARGFGMQNTCKVAGKRELSSIMKKKDIGPRFIHCIALPGNRDVPNIPLSRLEIKRQVQGFLTIR